MIEFFKRLFRRNPAEPTATIKRQTGIQQGANPFALPMNMSSVFERVGTIGPDVEISNESDVPRVLEFPMRHTIIRVPAHGKYILRSPVAEKVPDPTDSRKFRVREHDALAVAEDLITEYCRGIAYDRMTLAELKACTLPFPARAFPRIREEVGLKAQRIQ